MDILKCGTFRIGFKLPYIADPGIAIRIDQFLENKKEVRNVDFILETNQEYSIDDCHQLLGCDRDDVSLKIYRTKYGTLWAKEGYNDEIVCAYIVSEDFKKWTLIRCNKENRQDSFVILSNIFCYSVLPYGGIVFHGVIMEWNGMGIIISAESGGGKTTHARLWRDYENALIINGDRVLCRKVDEQWYAFGQPWCGTSGECVNRKVPIKAFVIIKKHMENKVERIDPYNAALKLAQRIFAPRGNKQLMNYAFDYIDDIVANIPVFELQCTPDITAVETLKKVLITL